MQYTLKLPSGRIINFNFETCAKLYQHAYGGTLTQKTAYK